jgi:SAM-dependent methyltransferase
MAEEVRMGRFDSTVATYERARPPYSPAFFAEVSEAIGLDGRQRLLDVGTGPGLLAIGFASACRSVTGVDPEPAMIEAATAAAARAGVRLTTLVGRLEDMSDAPAFEVVTIGRALHWLDPEPARRTLERIVAQRGMVVVCRADSVKDGRNPWLGAFTSVRRSFGETPPRGDDDSFLEGGRFHRAGTVTVETTYLLPVALLAERILSHSTTSPEKLGARVADMRDAVGEALAAYATGGLIDDIVAARAELFAG